MYPHNSYSEWSLRVSLITIYMILSVNTEMFGDARQQLNVARPTFGHYSLFSVIYVHLYMYIKLYVYYVMTYMFYLDAVGIFSERVSMLLSNFFHLK